MVKTKAATIGFGVEIRASTIPGGGNGLWTARFFRRNELITEYFGPIIDHKKALTLRYKNKHSHIRVLNLQFRYIDGIKKPQLGVGGASFANDARDSGKTNAVFVSRHDTKLARDCVFLKATRDLEPGTEVFVSYGDTYWENSKVAPGAAPASKKRRQRQQQQQQQQELEAEQHSPRDKRQLQRQQQQQRQCVPLQELLVQQQQSGSDTSEQQQWQPHHTTLQDMATAAPGNMKAVEPASRQLKSHVMQRGVAVWSHQAYPVQQQISSHQCQGERLGAAGCLGGLQQGLEQQALRQNTRRLHAEDTDMPYLQQHTAEAEVRSSRATTRDKRCTLLVPLQQELAGVTSVCHKRRHSQLGSVAKHKGTVLENPYSKKYKSFSSRRGA